MIHRLHVTAAYLFSNLLNIIELERAMFQNVMNFITVRYCLCSCSETKLC